MLSLFSCKKEIEEPLIDSPADRVRATAFFATACNSCQTQTIGFRGIRPDDPNGREPVANPERGFRLEHIMKASDLMNPYHKINHTNSMAALLKNDESNYAEKTKVTQLYFYLTDYMKTKIPEQAFRNMQSILDEIKKTGYKVILLFAYRYDESCQYETYDDIKRHLAQLKPFLQKNESLIYSFQAGFLGLWGEWHHSGLDNSLFHRQVVIRDILKTIPANKKMQVRETVYKTNAAGFIRRNTNSPILYYPLSTEECNRIGFQNAYFVLDQGPQCHWDYRWPDNDYLMVEKEALSTVVDGEMPYDGNGEYTFNTIAAGNQGGWLAAKRMRKHAHSSFSVVHNYKVNIAAWKKQFLSPAQFRNDKIEVTDDYFLDQLGRDVSRTAYEYIRDHLGYRFQLKDATIPAVVNRGDSASFSIRLKNFGFAPLINKRPVYLVLIDDKNQVSEFLTNADARKWLPANHAADEPYTIRHTISFPASLNPGLYKVGVWMPDDSNELKYDVNYAIHFANGNIEWWHDNNNKYLINILGSLDLQ
ncbi:MAG: DUF4832 domain-containing protein [Chitinophagaceae bacterium]